MINLISVAKKDCRVKQKRINQRLQLTRGENYLFNENEDGDL